MYQELGKSKNNTSTEIVSHFEELQSKYRKVLEKYGRHLESCNSYYMDGRSGQKLARKCSCGFDKVLGVFY